MTDEIIRFGKYKGQPVLALSGDKSYTDWLLSQPWFKEQHFNVYNIVVNNFRQIDDTPEHNALQIKFLDETYALKLAYLLNQNIFDLTSEQLNNGIKKTLAQQTYYLDIVKEKLPSFDKEKLLNITTPTFEEGYDVAYTVKYGLDLYVHHKTSFNSYSDIFKFNKQNYLRILIEIKPTVGDDFPSILRQMKASMPTTYIGNHIKRCLLVGEYTGVSASKEQFVQFFSSQGYNVVFESEINKINIPEYEKEFQFDNKILA